jgi:hypothetical protein
MNDPGTILGDPNTGTGLGNPSDDYFLGIPDVLTSCPVIVLECIGVECCDTLFSDCPGSILSQDLS